MHSGESSDKLYTKILIIDDELDICYLLSGILKRANFNTNYVTSLSAAQVALQEFSPSIIFLDNHLPDGLGLDFIKVIKTNYPHIKIVMITAHDSVIEHRKAFEEGVDFFIPKPFTKEKIYTAINELNHAF